MEKEKIEYIKELVAQIESDKKYTLLFITFNLTVMALIINSYILKNEPIIISLFEKITITIAIVFNFIGVIGFLSWYVLLHLLRIEKSDLFISHDIENSRRKHYPGNEFFKKNSLAFRVGYYSTGISIINYIIIILYRIWF
ncbi:MAG: hypothetical protein WCK78_17710 [Paludibacter sp.]